MGNFLNFLIDRATSQGYKSNVLKPLIGLEIVIFASSVYYCYVDAILLALLAGIMAFLILILFIGAFIYCLCKQPDLLRSERYNLQKQAMEQNISSSGNSMNRSPTVRKRHSNADPNFVFFTASDEKEGRK